jgi:hypothetical protein
MTTDERLEKLIERHEALALSVEMLAGMQRETEVLHRENEKRVAQIMDTMNRMGRIIEIHEQLHDDHDSRLNKLEGNL